MSIALNKLEQKALVSGFQFLKRFCAKGHTLVVHKGMVRCLEASKYFIIEVNLRLVLEDFSMALPWNPKIPGLFKSLTNTEGSVFINDTDDMMFFADAITTIHTPKKKSSEVSKYLQIIDIERRLGVNFNAPLVAVLIDKRMRQFAAPIFKTNRSSLIEIRVQDGLVESSAEALPDTLLESKMAVVWPEGNPPNLVFRVPLKYLCRVPADSVLRAYRIRFQDKILWELSGAIYKNPLVPFRIMGTAPILSL